MCSRYDWLRTAAFRGHDPRPPPPQTPLLDAQTYFRPQIRCGSRPTLSPRPRAQQATANTTPLSLGNKKPDRRGLIATQAPGVSDAPVPEPEPLRVDSGSAASTSGSSFSRDGPGADDDPQKPPQQQQGSNGLTVAWRRLLRELSSLPRAIAIMAAIATLSGLGTIIPQNKVGLVCEEGDGIITCR
jgi:hypothetical protein